MRTQRIDEAIDVARLVSWVEADGMNTSTGRRAQLLPRRRPRNLGEQIDRFSFVHVKFNVKRSTDPRATHGVAIALCSWGFLGALTLLGGALPLSENFIQSKIYALNQRFIVPISLLCSVYCIEIFP